MEGFTLQPSDEAGHRDHEEVGDKLCPQAVEGADHAGGGYPGVEFAGQQGQRHQGACPGSQRVVAIGAGLALLGDGDGLGILAPIRQTAVTWMPEGRSS